ncbi:ninjurin-2 isoform X4 [Parasteatoda tepidariorum]|uniref:ninjurin-2 isoform X4 n=1 Tax=Parasteatoda tepidariorum TaxID=114398 RepID=UPI0039BD15E4
MKSRHIINFMERELPKFFSVRSRNNITTIASGKEVENITGNGDAVPSKPLTIGPLDANVYATKKTIAQGLLDVALLTANASQLKYLLQAGKEHEFYYVMMTLISLSIILQMCLGSVLILKGRCDINDAGQQGRADRLNNASLWIVYASTVIHAFLSVFHIAPEEQKPFASYTAFRTNASIPTPDSDY